MKIKVFNMNILQIGNIYLYITSKGIKYLQSIIYELYIPKGSILRL